MELCGGSGGLSHAAALRLHILNRLLLLLNIRVLKLGLILLNIRVLTLGLILLNILVLHLRREGWCSTTHHHESGLRRRYVVAVLKKCARLSCFSS